MKVFVRSLKSSPHFPLPANFPKVENFWKVGYAIAALLLLSAPASSQTLDWANQPLTIAGGNDEGRAIARDASGNVYVTGSFQFTSDFDPGVATANLASAGGTDMYLAKYDASGNYVWAFKIGGTGADVGLGVALDASNNVFVTGSFSGTNVDFDPGAGTANLSSTGGTDIFVAKYDASGNYVWAFPVGGGSNDVGNGLAVDASGNVVITGLFRTSNVDFDPGVSSALLSVVGSEDIFVAKYDASGAYQWAFGAGSSNADVGNGVAVDGSGNVHVTGYFSQTVDFDPGGGTATLTSTASTEIFIAKYDASGNYVWAGSMGGSNDDRGFGIALDGTGNVYVTGYFNLTADFDPGGGTANLTSSGGREMFLAKYNTSGGYLWAQQIGGSGNDEGYNLKVDGSNNVHVTGYFNGVADFDPGAGTASLTSSGNDVFIAKYDASGNYVWAGQAGGSGSDIGYGLVLDGSGNVYTTGLFNNTGADFDPGAGTATLNAGGGTDAFVLRLSSAGNYNWAINWGQYVAAPSSMSCNDLVRDASGNVYATGYFQGTNVDFDPGAGTAYLTSAGGSDIFIAKYDASGNYLWARQVGGTVADIGNSMALDGSGNLYVMGTFTGNVDFDPGAGSVSLTSAGGTDIFITKYDAAGNFLWAGQMGGTGADTGNSLAADASGNIFVTGNFQNSNADFDPGPATAILTSAGPATVDMFIAKYDASGNYLWAKQVGSTLNDTGRGVAVDASGNGYSTGQFQGTVDFGGGAGVLTSAGSNDIFIAKFDASGNCVWARQVGGSGSDIGYSLAADAGGNVFVTGQFTGSNIDFDPGTGAALLTSAGSNDIFIARYDASGNYLWVRQVGGTGGDLGAGVTLDGSNNVYITGQFSGSNIDFDPGPGTALLTSAGNLDIFIAKYDASGNYNWAVQMGGVINDSGEAIATNGGEKVNAGGIFDETADFDPGAGTVNRTAVASSGDIYIAQYTVPAPDINLKGNAVSIADGDVTPATADDTDFGIVCVPGSTNPHTFTIENTGTADLTLAAGSITITGAHASDFALSGITLPATVTAGNSTTFTVTFDPPTTGQRTATVNIANNDGDENPYNFDIKGRGNNPYTFSGTGDWTNTGNWSPSYPGLTVGACDEVIIAAGANCTIPNGTTVTNNGTITVNGTISKVAGSTLTNSATGTVAITAGGALNNDAGTFTNAGSLTTASGGAFGNGSGTFTNSGTYNNGGSHYSTYGGFTNSGTITNTGTMTSGQYINIGNTGTWTNAVGATMNMNALTNSGSAVLTNNGTMGIGLANSATFVNNATFAVSYLTQTNTASGTWTNSPGATMTLGLLPFSNAGAFHNDGSFTLNPGSGLENFVNTATGVFNTSGSLSLNTSAASNAAGGNINVTAGTFTMNGFTNNGAIAQTGGSVVNNGIYNGNNGAFTGAEFNNTGGTVAPGLSPGCLVFAAGYTNGTGTQQIEIGGTTPCTQHDQVQVTGTAALSGTLTISRYNNYLPLVTESYTILTATTVSGTFATVNYPTICGVTWSIVYNANDVVVTATVAAQPEIDVQGGSPLTSIVDGDAVPSTTDGTDFGNVAVNGSLVRTFTIFNTGNAALSISSITSSNPKFTIGTLTPAGTIAGPSGFATFTVTFLPTATGTQNATITINNNDCNEAVYDFAVTGTGITPGAALTFDGSDDYVNLGTSAFEFVGSYTIETWVNATFGSSGNFSLAGRIMDKGVAGGEGPDLDLFGGIRFISANGGSGPYFITAPTQVPANTWSHIAVTIDVANLVAKIYYNGALVKTQTLPGDVAANPTYNLLLGATDGGGSATNFFNGKLDEFRVWNRALCQNEIQAQMNCELSGSESGLMIYYNFNQGIAGDNNSGLNTVNDVATGSGHGGTNNGALTNFTLSGPTSNWTAPGGVTSGVSCSAFVDPEADVQGGSPLTTIADGDATPSTTDGTDFGNVAVNGSLVRTFTIFNTGNAALSISSITSSNPKFTIGALTPAGTIAGPSGSATFTVTFLPTTTGTQNATITINNNDCDEAVYDFVVTGTGATPASALNFDGIDDYITTANNTILDLSTQTVEFWAKPSGSGGDNDLLVGKRNYNGTNNSDIRWSIHFQNGNQGLYFYSPAGQAVWAYTFTPNQWYHIAMVTDATSTKLYIDGTFISSKATTINSPTNLPVLFGASAPNFEVFPGSLDEVRIWNTTRTCDQINQLRNCELTGSESGLMAYYKFNQGFAGEDNTTPPVNTLTDATANANNGTLTGFTLTGAISNWVTPGGVVTGTSCPAVVVPEIDVRGGSPLVSILDGDATPSTTDGTDFGNVAVNGNLTRMFSIFNTGNDALSIGSITSSNPKFTIGTLTPASPIAGPSGSATFTVTFSPTATGTQTATITINNNDCDEAVYDFVVTGKGAQPGAALHFDGVNDDVAIPHASNITFDINQDFTISLHVKIPSSNQPNTGNIDNDIVEKVGASGGYPYVIRYLNHTADAGSRGKIIAARWNGSTAAIVSSTAALNDDNWHHIAFVKSGPTLYLYVDGVLNSTTPDLTTGSTTNTGPLYLGSRQSQINWFNGSMDNLSIWNIARSCEEIRQQSNCELAGSESGLVAYYNFNHGFANENNSGVTTLTDAAGGDNNGTLSNNFALTGPTSNWVTPGGVTTGTSCPAVTAPEADVRGGSPLTTINDGDNTPTTTDHTDFGNVAVNGSLMRTFTILNTGNTDLTITSITSSNPTKFTIGALSSPSPITAGNSATFTVTFLPTAAGVENATITINNNDCDEAVYDFAIQGTVPSSYYALDFDGVNDYVDVPAGLPAFDEFTIEAWVRPESFGGLRCILMYNSFNTGYLHYQFNGNQMEFSINGNAPIDQYLNATTFTANTWYHIAAVYSKSAKTLKWYVNGILQETDTYATAIGLAPNVGFKVGSWDGSSRFFDGQIDEVRMWNTTLSDSELAARYNKTTADCDPLWSNLTTYWNFEENSGNMTADKSNSCRNGFITNGGAWTTTVPTLTPYCNGNLSLKPEINVKGNSTDITDGDITPSTTDHTDFGNVLVNGSLVRTFTIFNTGTAALTVSSITSDNVKFVVSGAPTSVAAGSSASFTVTFNPTALGVQNATITINSNDCDEAVYDFVVTGKGATPAAALNFDGTDDFVSVPDAGSLDLGSSLTLEAWVKPESFSVYNMIIDKRDLADVNANYGLTLTNGKPMFYFWNGGNVSFHIATNAIALNAFTHLAATYDGAMVRIFVNGTQVYEQAETDVPPSNNQPLSIGRNQVTLQYFDGDIDEVRIWNTVRNCDEIGQRYNCELSVPQPGLVAYYKFNQGFAAEDNTTPPVNTLTDATANANNGTLTGFTLTGAISNWVAPGGVTTGTSCPAVTAPEADVQGGSPLTTIADGDNTPSTTDHTDFGLVAVNGSLVRTFTIFNTGNTALTVSSITSDNVKFVVSGAPTSVAAGSSASFTVTFNPTALGVQNATITINNDDCDEAAYDFVVTGKGATPASALHFDGVNDNVSIPNHAALQLDQFTLETWFNPSTAADFPALPPALIAKGAAGSPDYFMVPMFNSRKIAAGFWSGASFVTVLSTTDLAQNTWYHLAATFDGTSLKIYVNGVLENTVDAAGLHPQVTTNALSLGLTNTTQYVNGALDEVRIWNIARTCEEIRQLRNCELMGSEGGLVAYYKFNQGFANENNSTVTTLTDAATTLGGANDGTLGGFTLSGPASNWVTPGGVVTGTSCPAVTAPEADVRGGSPLTTINDGDNTPSTTDHTDFGLVAVNGSLVRTFTIFNTGTAALTVSSITSDNVKFVVSGAPTSVAATSSATFTVTFNPTALGVQNASITINNNDCDEAEYDFAISGTGACPTTGAVWYVDGAASGGGNGASWDCAFQNLQDAINAASSGDQIWVKAGTYKPTQDPFGNASPTNSRDKTFYLKDGVKIYGGFNGTETLLGQRNTAVNLTTLSGDFSGNDVGFTNNTENAYHVVLSVSDGNATVLDGFTVKGGNADGSGFITVESQSPPQNSGGGVYNYASSATINNCRFIENSASDVGGGMLNHAASPMVSNCLFSGNKAAFGGGMFNRTSSAPTVNTCIFSENTASGGGGSSDDNSSGTYVSCQFLSNTATDGATYGTGGGFQHAYSGNSQFTNCTFYDNKALGTNDDGGGAVMAYGGSTSLNNCSFSSNVCASTYAGNGGAVSVYSGASTTIKNCILWGDTNGEIFSNGTITVTYSIVQGGFAGTGNLNKNPLYVSASDLHLTPSPAIDAGTATGAPATDLDGNARPVNFGYDMGAYEYQLAIPKVAVEGNATTIADGDNTPSTTDHTDFGTTVFSRMFTIFNTGNALLTIDGITVTGGNSGDFSIAGAPTTVVAGSSAMFTVNFAPTAAGLRTTTVHIVSDGSNEADYDFVIQATATPAKALHFDGFDDEVIGTSPTAFWGTTPTSIEFWVKKAPGADMFVGDLGFTYQVRITNGALNLSGFFLGNFATANSLIADNTWTHCAITYDGLQTNASYKAYINGSPVAFTGSYGSHPSTNGQLRMGIANNNYHFTGSLDEVRVWKEERSAAQILANYNTEIAGMDPCLDIYWKFNQGFIGANNSTETSATDAANAVVTNGTLSNFALNNATSNWVAGSGITETASAYIPAPEADLLGHNNTALADGTTGTSVAQGTNLGSVNFGSSSAAKTFTIQNNGTAALNVNSIASSNAQFTVTALSPASPIPAGMPATFTLTFTPTATGVQNATITIDNDDCDEAIYTFAVTGTGVCVPPSFTVCPTGPVTANTVTGTCAAPVNYTVTEAGNPAPTVTYTFTGATTDSGTGTGSGSTFNKGNTTVTVTATSSCSPPATCTFMVTVTDLEKPEITCTGPVTVNTTTGLCTGTATLTAPTASDNCSGVFGNALNFDGTNDYITAGNVTQLSGATKLTLESWIYPTNGSTGMVMGKGTTTSANAINIERNGQTLYFRVCGASDSYGFVNNVLPTNTWTHIACVYDGALTGNANRLKIYINGVLQTLSFTGSIPASAPSSTAPLTVGAFNSSTIPLGASLDEVRIWNTARTQVEIQANMNSEISAQGGLAVLYHFNQGVAYANNAAVTTATDDSGNGYTGTLNGFGLNGASSNWIAFSPTLSNNAPATFPKGITTVTWTARDDSGNTETCQQTVTVVDNEAPMLANPGNEALNVIVTTCAANYTIADPVSDNCTVATWGYTLSGATTAAVTGIADGTGSGVISFNKGVTTVVLSATDGTNSATTVSFTVTVTDLEKPEITCDGPVTVNTTAGLCTGTATLTAPTVTDNCPFGGNGLNFDGSDDQVTSAAYSGTALTGDLTMECWFKGTAMHGRTLFGRGFQQEFDLTLWFNQLNYYHGNGTTWVNLTFNYVFSDNTWYHVAVLRNATAQTVSLYVNGVFQQTLSYGTPLPVAQTAAFRIGNRAAGQFFSGSIDEVRVWTVARTPAQIAGNWNQELTAQPDLFALYHLNEGSANGNNAGATTAADASGNAQDGALANFALSGTSSNWVVGAFGGVTNNAPATYPKGNTTVTWTATDASGNTETCQQTVTVTDNEPPTITCPTNQTVPPTQTSPCAAVVSSIDATYNDNCAGSTLAYVLSDATTGSGSGQASGQTFLLGTTTVTYTVTDEANLTSSCMFTVTVTNCNITFAGKIEWSDDQTTGVNNATVNLTGASSGNDLSDVAGDYLVSAPYATGNFTLTPVKNTNKLNGVTVADATAIQQHIATTVPITNPYRQVAADVNKSNSITTFDATLINQALLGSPSALAQIKTSWRFVPQSHTMLLPPWGFPEKIDLTGVTTNQTGQDFYGIKTGDLVTAFANPANFGAGEPLVLRVKDEVLTAGSELVVAFSANALDDLAAWQFALQFDPSQLQALEIQPLGALPLSIDHFGTFNLAVGEIRSVWSQPLGMALEESAPVFHLKFKVLQSGSKLSEVLELSDDILPGHVYTSTLAESGVTLEFYEVTGTGPTPGILAYRLLQNIPNPFVEKTNIGFVLPGACDATLRVFDGTGRLLREHSAWFAAGKNAVEFDFGTYPASGVLYYELTTPFGVLAKKMVLAGE